jgi:hypothetical protein
MRFDTTCVSTAVQEVAGLISRVFILITIVQLANIVSQANFNIT